MDARTDDARLEWRPQVAGQHLDKQIEGEARGHPFGPLERPRAPEAHEGRQHAHDGAQQQAGAALVHEAARNDE